MHWQSREGGILKLLLALFLATIAVVVTLVVIFLFNDEWQRAVFDRALENQEGRKIQVESIRVRPSQIRIEGLFALDRGVGVEARRVDLKGPLWRLPVFGELQIEQGILENVFLDLSQLDPGSLDLSAWQRTARNATQNPAQWEDQLTRWMSQSAGQGIDILIEDTVITGMALLPGDLQIPVSLHILQLSNSNEPVAEIEMVSESTGENEL